jgi:hypothetical protein
MSLPNPPSRDWLDQKYELGVQAEHIALGEEQRFLARVRDEEMDNAEETSIPVQVNSIDAPLTQEELNINQPLSAPPSLNGFPHKKTRGLHASLVLDHEAQEPRSGSEIQRTLATI